MAASSEVAFFSLTYNDLRSLEDETSPASKRVVRLVNLPRKLLATILITNNFVNICLVVTSDYIIHNLLPDVVFLPWATWLNRIFPFLHWTIETWERAIGFSINVVGVTFLIVLFGEVAPKIYANTNKISLAKAMSGPFTFLNTLFSPLSFILVKGSKFIEQTLDKNNERGSGRHLTSEDLDEAIELTVRNENDADKEVDILKRIVKFSEVSAKQIMCPRTDVVGVDFRTGFDELIQIVTDSGFSRLPVYDGDFDNITGILYVKDLIEHFGNTDLKFEWQALIRPNIIYAPESKKINDLLKDFQKQRLHMAIVVDEYGGSAGIVTLEDIMEEVIGEIRDEFDDETDLDYQKIDDSTYIFEGKTLLNDVCRVVKIDTETFESIKGDADSLAGLVLELIGDFPKPDTEVTHNNYLFKVLVVNKRRIEKVQVTLPS
jgi:putative hemolysin